MELLTSLHAIKFRSVNLLKRLLPSVVLPTQARVLLTFSLHDKLTASCSVRRLEALAVFRSQLSQHRHWQGQPLPNAR